MSAEKVMEKIFFCCLMGFLSSVLVGLTIGVVMAIVAGIFNV